MLVGSLNGPFSGIARECGPFLIRTERMDGRTEATRRERTSKRGACPIVFRLPILYANNWRTTTTEVERRRALERVQSAQMTTICPNIPPGLRECATTMEDMESCGAQETLSNRSVWCITEEYVSQSPLFRRRMRESIPKPAYTF